MCVSLHPVSETTILNRETAQFFDNIEREKDNEVNIKFTNARKNEKWSVILLGLGTTISRKRTI